MLVATKAMLHRAIIARREPDVHTLKPSSSLVARRPVPVPPSSCPTPDLLPPTVRRAGSARYPRGHDTTGETTPEISYLRVSGTGHFSPTSRPTF